MKVRLETVFKGYAIVLVALLVWAVWAGAQTNDNGPTNEPRSRFAAAGAAARERLISADAPLDFGLRHVQALQYPVFDIPLWQYLASFIYVVLAFVAARLLDWLIRGKLRHWAARTKTRLDDILLELLRGPIKLIVFVILLHVGLRLFPWPNAFEFYVSKGLIVAVAISLTYLALKIIDVLLDYWRQRATSADDRALSDHLLPFVGNTAKVFALIVAVLLTAESLGIRMTSVIASLSVGGLAIGLAAQDTLANLFGAVAVFVDKPFRVGDRIRIEQTEGVVETIGMRSTRVRTADGHLVAVPNKTVGNATITNIARRPNIRTVMNIGVTYDTPVHRLKRGLEILQEVYGQHPMTKEVLITFNRFADSALNIEVVHFWNSTDHKEYLKGLQELNLTVKERFDAEGIEFAFPTQTIYVKSDVGGKGTGEAEPKA